MKATPAQPSAGLRADTPDPPSSSRGALKQTPERMNNVPPARISKARKKGWWGVLLPTSRSAWGVGGEACKRKPWILCCMCALHGSKYTIMLGTYLCIDTRWTVSKEGTNKWTISEGRNEGQPITPQRKEKNLTWGVRILELTVKQSYISV